jgi:hypothetical protein
LRSLRATQIVGGSSASMTRLDRGDPTPSHLEPNVTGSAACSTHVAVRAARPPNSGTASPAAASGRPRRPDALSGARHWPPLPYDRLVRDISRPFHVRRFACASGWALATDGQNLSVYEQGGPGFKQPIGRHWLRVGVGSPRLIGTKVEFALARSVLNRLGNAIGVRLPPPAPVPSSEYPPQALTDWQRAPISVSVRPAESYSTSDLFLKRPRILIVHLRSGDGRTTITHFRWQDHRWKKQPAGR